MIRERMSAEECRQRVDAIIGEYRRALADPQAHHGLARENALLKLRALDLANGEAARWLDSKGDRA